MDMITSFSKEMTLGVALPCVLSLVVKSTGKICIIGEGVMQDFTGPSSNYQIRVIFNTLYIFYAYTCMGEPLPASQISFVISNKLVNHGNNS